MTREELAALARTEIPRSFLLEMLDDFVGRAKGANTIIREHTDLAPRRAARIEGHLRFQSLEQGFEAAGGRHAALSLLLQVLPGSDRVIYQPFQRFGSVILGFAMHSEAGTLPTRNKSRAAAVQLNFDFTDHLDLPAPDKPQNILFVLILVARDKAIAGALDSIEVAVIDPSFDHFLYCEKIERFLAGYGEPKPAGGPRKPTPPEAPLVKLRKTPKPMLRPAPPIGGGDLSKKDKKGD